ncbi:MAG: hypothetical protein ACR2QA_05515 [Solirubrobacteraceae bacterium]
MDETWTGWWGEEPPYYAPVFVLTHHAREPLSMLGSMRFMFVTMGSSLRWSKPGRRPAIGRWLSPAGASRVQQYLAVGCSRNCTYTSFR